MIKKAMVLAAGFGKRVNPVTLKSPKALLDIGDETLLSNTLKFLQSSGINEVVVNTHYLREKIIHYIKKKNFDLAINIVEEKDKILDTGGGVLNAIEYFKNEPFLIINPDTIWNAHYIKEFELMKNFFFKNKNKCLLLVVEKLKSFDNTFKGDFNIKNNLVNRDEPKKLNYVYTGLQIIKPDIFSNVTEKIFSMNKVWDNLIERKELFAIESKLNFFHVSTLDIYNKLLKLNLNIS